MKHNSRQSKAPNHDRHTSETQNFTLRITNIADKFARAICILLHKTAVRISLNSNISSFQHHYKILPRINAQILIRAENRVECVYDSVIYYIQLNANEGCNLNQSLNVKLERLHRMKLLYICHEEDHSEQVRKNICFFTVSIYLACKCQPFFSFQLLMKIISQLLLEVLDSPRILVTVPLQHRNYP